MVWLSKLIFEKFCRFEKGRSRGRGLASCDDVARRSQSSVRSWDMPQRPSKKPKTQPAPKAGAQDKNAGKVHGSRQRHTTETTKAILGKFQGRKSI
jgi:hypothetical protein